ncbi:hypothetical protein NM688_g4619 [Phlebia brevispora]|uniref:Uncharacterized protein n=1 Tax=Phlebia brevispora TaxID=194682 RepID=A0ACC1T2R0_9APHY|nr:hypothetical protein NM688_g4619 [Phlebia brevispora]
MSEPVPCKLFAPIQVGKMSLKHRVVMAPLTRTRADSDHVHTKLAVEYYAQRASVPGTLLVSEATFIAAQAGGWAFVPGIWSDAQVEAWKPIVEAVHAKGSYIFMQLWALGRTADPELLESEGPYPFISASDVKMSDGTLPPRPLTIPEIKEYVQLYATAAYNAVHRAGFDGVEVHGSNGFLVDQFTQDVSNKRTDDYGGSIENRSRFALEVVGAIAERIGADRTGIRLSPWGRIYDMRMEDPIPQFTHLVSELARQHPSMAYIHVVEPRVHRFDDIEVPPGESNDFMRDIWFPRPLISAGGYKRENALDVAEEKGDLIAFGRYFISNPDLPIRLLQNIPLAKGDRSTYYARDEVGYTDYPTAEEEYGSPRQLQASL